MAERDHRYNNDDAADISGTGVILTLDTKDRALVSAILHEATASASYLVESHYDEDGADAEWHTLADNDTTTGFRFEGRVPERYVRIRVDGAAAGGDTAHVSLNATNGD